jgi:hypothetical protein
MSTSGEERLELARTIRRIVTERSASSNPVLGAHPVRGGWSTTARA